MTNLHGVVFAWNSRISTYSRISLDNMWYENERSPTVSLGRVGTVGSKVVTVSHNCILLYRILIIYRQIYCMNKTLKETNIKLKGLRLRVQPVMICRPHVHPGFFAADLPPTDLASTDLVSYTLRQMILQKSLSLHIIRKMYFGLWSS